MNTDNKYLKTIAKNTGSNVNGKLKTNNAYLHMIAENTKHSGGGGGDLPLDELLEDVNVRIVNVADTPVTGFEVGDIYLDFEMKVGKETKHIYLLADDFKDQSYFTMNVDFADGSSKTYRIIGEEIVTQ